MWRDMSAFVAGWAVRDHCGGLPCRARWRGAAARKVKLSVKFVSLECDGLVGGQLLPTARPYIVVQGDDATGESCLGDWSRTEGRWLFGEAVTIQCTRQEKLSFTAYAKAEVAIWRVELSWAGVSGLGTTGVDLAQHVFPMLVAEDRDDDGLVYATPNLVFSIRDKAAGTPCGRLTLRFETSSAPLLKPGMPFLSGCGMFARPMAAEDEDDFGGEVVSPLASRAMEHAVLGDPAAMHRGAELGAISSTRGTPCTLLCEDPIACS